jgi:DNA-binding MarR family transcriptional regulator
MYHQPPRDDKEDTITVSVKGADLQGLTEALRQLLEQFDILTADSAEFPQRSGSASEADLRGWAIRIARARRARLHVFAKSMFGEPAWDMLLHLYINADYGTRHSVGCLSDLSGAAPTTALRWLDYLEKEKLVAREPNPTDRRTEFVQLTEKGRSAMAQYLSGTIDSPL